MGQGNRLKAPAAQKPKGWFSRRHQDDTANREARERYRSERGPEARQRRADEREA
jgi:hypothetical protein